MVDLLGCWLLQDDFKTNLCEIKLRQFLPICVLLPICVATFADLCCAIGRQLEPFFCCKGASRRSGVWSLGLEVCGSGFRSKAEIKTELAAMVQKVEQLRYPYTSILGEKRLWVGPRKDIFSPCETSPTLYLSIASTFVDLRSVLEQAVNVHQFLDCQGASRKSRVEGLWIRV